MNIYLVTSRIDNYKVSIAGISFWIGKCINVLLILYKVRIQLQLIVSKPTYLNIHTTAFEIHIKWDIVAGM